MSHTNTENKTIHVFVNRRKVELPDGSITAAALLAAAGFEGTAWDILELQGEGDPTGGTLLQADTVIDLKEGLRFRVLPGDRTFGGGPRRREEPPEGDQAGAGA